MRCEICFLSPTPCCFIKTLCPWSRLGPFQKLSMHLNNWPVGTASNKDWSADAQDDHQNPQKRSLHLVTSCYTPLYPRHTLFLPRYTLLYSLYTLLNHRYTLYTSLHTVTSMLHPGRSAASKFVCPCYSQFFVSSTKLWILLSTNWVDMSTALG